ncbi:hypothetical protein ASG52_01120 [Methylobacterium sp. Leaf456]|uniref:hypothetical protein n=1 Tax=Methylobacterium sp. Leaf456 TaxID=1736382 RepID=UPI000713BC76|nr:hypothetical protein [Methylobacterium sp. Leaf456]KQT61519.1 hypothetical protein ASG52_01120 [Methylobacterium sp. Leaf456]
MANHPEFDPQSIDQALEAARRHAQDRMPKATNNQTPLDDGSLKVAAQCISVTVQNGQVCLNLPLGIGSVCLPVPSWIPNGTAAQACIDICTKWGIPCGVEVTVSVAGQRIVQKNFGCSC